MKLTLQQLTDAEACAPQVAMFRSLFGDSVEVTEDSCVAVFDKFKWNFAANNFLTPAARDEYKRVTTPARDEYDRVRAAAWAEYKRGTAAAMSEYRRVGASAGGEYDRVRAAAFGRLYSTDAQPI